MEKNGDCIGSLRYEYRIADHLGNTRAVYADTENDGEAELLQEEAYYPFGMRIPSMSKSYSGSSDDRYLYNGKELEGRLSGFHFSDYGARFYDAALGRWHSVDPLAEKYTSLTPYNYVGNNPINSIDPDGKRNISALLWARENLLQIPTIPYSPWFGGDAQGGWTYKQGTVPTEMVCYDACFVAYMNSEEQTLNYLKNTGFSNKYSAFKSRFIGIGWFKEGGEGRKFETDILKGEKGDIIFQGGDGEEHNDGHASILSELPDLTVEEFENEDGSVTKIETLKLKALSTSSKGFKEFNWTYQRTNGGGWQGVGSTMEFSGYGQLSVDKPLEHMEMKPLNIGL